MGEEDSAAVVLEGASVAAAVSPEAVERRGAGRHSIWDRGRRESTHMLVVMKAEAAQADVERIKEKIRAEVQLDPESALSDGYQSLRPDKFRRLLERLQELAPFVGRRVNLSARHGVSSSPSPMT